MKPRLIYNDGPSLGDILAKARVSAKPALKLHERKAIEAQRKSAFYAEQARYWMGLYADD